MFNQLIVLRGLDKRLIAVKKEQVLYLSEGELNDNLHTNLHFPNGHFITSSLSLREVKAVLETKAEEENVDQVNKWKRQAQISMEMDAKKDEVRKLMAEQFAGYTQKSWSTSKDENGVLTVTAILAPTKEVIDSEMAAKMAEVMSAPQT